MHKRMMITGAGSGLGREIALRWAREGWQLALADVNEVGLRETLELVRAAGGDGFVQRCDVRDYSQLTALAQACDQRLGGCDVIVNNAGVASGGFFSELSLEDWDWQIAINLMGVVKGCKAFLPLLERSQGRIINIASMAALMQGPGMSNYNVAKAGVLALSESLLVELRQVGVARGLPVVLPDQPAGLVPWPDPGNESPGGQVAGRLAHQCCRYCRVHSCPGGRRRVPHPAPRSRAPGMAAQVPGAPAAV
jgi:NAD(P)-dependent dehydrogenase (short-subunit alcohol dehydrogenase family)